MRIGARKRLQSFLDKDSFQELAKELKPKDMLNFKDTKSYKDRLSQAQKKTSESDALILSEGLLMDKPVVTSAFEFSFLGGSMGSVVGEKFLRGVHRAIEKMPLHLLYGKRWSTNAGVSILLMKMAKVSAGLARLARHKLPYIVVLTDPTTGGVSASLAM